ncbi:MAG: rhomboid family intramembrane serine protease [Fermentimonas sp.]|jgi:membrane associated rhomboid family serine protease|nr:rhomboid family intramembrane serine protease [Fermentimonas sp.]NLC86166.1 rhomboid family intramembrane serine protease [Bacteroidales bacterium]HBT86753.1 rhomboid family intramembrane serine protease [Porphyromonadaceae bacterium]MDD2930768.1 rhomboid family intramembrane serine protease [Fermentimonas sp.]MDD3189365.1 rhomboid family intramembrane serine protease [Fermentimonas sp.]
MNDYRRNSFAGDLPIVTKNLLIINVIVWLAQFVLLRRADIDLTQQFGLHFPFSDNFRIYQLVTYMFLHDPYSFSHVFFNMFAVFMFGRTLEQVWGPKRFLTYYMVTGIGAGLVQILVLYLRISSVVPADMFYAVNSVTVGASGAVFGILLAFGMLFPNAQLFIIPFPFPIKAKWFVIGYGLLELLFGVFNRTGDNVAHFAHLGGMLFGIFMILYWRKKDRTHGRFY